MQAIWSSRSPSSTSSCSFSTAFSGYNTMKTMKLNIPLQCILHIMLVNNMELLHTKLQYLSAARNYWKNKYLLLSSVLRIVGL
jgi:hypothetical protein